MGTDITQILGVSVIGLTIWGMGFYANRHGAVMGKPIRLPAILATLMGSTRNEVAGGILIVQVWGLVCILLTLVLNLMSVDFDTRVAVILTTTSAGVFISVIVAKAYGKRGK